MPDSLGSIAFIVVVGGLIALLLFKTVQQGGLRGAILNARILETIGVVEGEPVYMVRTRFTINRIATARTGSAVGIELRISEPGRLQLLASRLPPDSARKLAAYLLEAAEPQSPKKETAAGPASS
jgi:hypothetical protein